MQSTQEGTKNHKSVIVSVAFGLFVFGVGWCAMLVFWNFYGGSESRGFTFFVSFLFGDSIFLPILAGALLAYIKLNSSSLSNKLPTLAQERWAWIIAIISALMGAFIQGSWLLSDHTELNWTIPKLHEFNSAGWWHAGFFVFIFAAIGYLFMRFIIARFHNALDEEAAFNARSKEKIFRRFWKTIVGKPSIETTSRRFAMYLIWFGASGYTYLRQQEGLNIDFVDWQLLVMIPGAALVGWLASSLLCGRRPTVDDVRLALAGALSAYGIVEVSVGLLYETVTLLEILIAVTSALLAIRLVPICPSDKHKTITAEIMVGLSAFGAILTYLRAQTIIQTIVIGVLSLLILLFIADIRGLLHMARMPAFQKTHMRKITYFLSPCLLLVMMLLWLVIMPGSDLSSARELLFAGVLSLGITIGIGLFTAFAKLAEDDDGADDILVGKDAAYVRIVLMVIGLLMISILFVGQATLDFSYTSTWGLLLILPFSVVCIAMHVIPWRKPIQTEGTDSVDSMNRFQPRVVVLLLLLALAYILLFFLIIGLREPVYTSVWDALLLFPIVGSTLFIANGIIQNSRFLCGITLSDVKKDRVLHIAIAEIILGCLCVFPLAILPSKQSDSIAFSILSPLIGILGLYLASCTLPRLAIQAVGCPPKGLVINNAGFAGVKQDTWNSFIMISIAGLFVIHLVEWQLFQNNKLVMIITFLGFLFGVGVVVKFTLENNSRHFRRTYVNGVFKNTQSQGIDIAYEQRVLRKHLEHQAHLVLITLFPYSLSCLFVPLLKKQPEEIREINVPFEVAVYNDYLLRLPGLRKYADNEQYNKYFFPELLPLSYRDNRGGRG